MNFDRALDLCSRKSSYEELIMLLRSDKVVDKQIAALFLDTIKSSQDAALLVSNLTGQDGKVREVVSCKLKEFMENPKLACFFANPEFADIFFDATLDINGNICRNIISAIKNLKNERVFCEKYVQKLVNTTKSLILKVKEFNLFDGKYKVNKEVFKLYWCLEALYEFIDFVDIVDVKSILSETKLIDEYTIREKTAKILTKNFDDEVLVKIKEELKRDKNYYVRRF